MLGYLEMRIRGYESDRTNPFLYRSPFSGAINVALFVCYFCPALSLGWRLIPGRRVVIFKFNTHEYVYLTEEWDRSPQSILWSQDSKSLYLTTEDQGHIKLFHLPLPSANSTPSTPTAVITQHSLSAVHWANDYLLITTST